MSNAVPAIARLAIPSVSLLILFLAYSSQLLFTFIEPGPLSWKEAFWFNFFVLLLWWCYYNTCTIDAAPPGWVSKALPHLEIKGENVEARLKESSPWCKKCEKVKPPRAHHCKICGICVPKMDHHCPWTANCVSHTTFPHFLRFVFYAVVSMSILKYHLCVRGYVLWESRNLPAYLGPPVWTLVHLLILFVVNGVVLFALFILLTRVLYGLVTNVTTIESWEIERHETLVERSRKTGGYVYAKGGQQIRIRHQEFPYDVGFWKNFIQAMGTKNFLMWLLPWGGAPSVDSAGVWEVNGFEDEDTKWPPPDPDRLPCAWHLEERTVRDFGTVEEEIAAFKRRQQADLKRRGFKENFSLDIPDSPNPSGNNHILVKSTEKEEWKNADGDHLRDYGVDEEAEDISEGILLPKKSVPKKACGQVE